MVQRGANYNAELSRPPSGTTVPIPAARSTRQRSTGSPTLAPEPPAQADQAAPIFAAEAEDVRAASDEFDATLGGVLSSDGTRLEISATIGIRGSNILEMWVTKAYDFFKLTSESAALGLEVGPKGGAAHLQITAVFLVACPFGEACDKIKEAIRAFIPMNRGSKGYIQVKALERGQSYSMMLGYISKLPLRVLLHNVTDAELSAGQAHYRIVKTDAMTGKRAINKSNFFKEIYSFWFINLKPIDYDIEVITYFAMQSGDYMPTSVWVLGGSGEGLDFSRATQYWRVLRDPTKVTMADVRSIFFTTRGNRSDRYFGAAGLASEFAEPECDWRQAKDRAQEARHDEVQFHFDGPPTDSPNPDAPETNEQAQAPFRPEVYTRPHTYPGPVTDTELQEASRRRSRDGPGFYESDEEDDLDASGFPNPQNRSQRRRCSFIDDESQF
jgi:hypothetical protein